MITLREAAKAKKINQFVREHEKDAPGDSEKLDLALKKPVSQRSKEAPKASQKRASDD